MVRFACVVVTGQLYLCKAELTVVGFAELMSSRLSVFGVA